MRLGQLARRLSRRQNEIVTFLSEHGIQIDDGSNTRLEDEHVVLIMKQYAPKQEEKMIETLALEKGNPEEPLMPENQSVHLEPEFEEIQDLRTEIPEVIRVQKVELSGLKVLGKIELSQHKKEEPNEPLAEPLPIPAPELKPHKSDRKVFQQRKDRIDQKQKKNPIALQREHESKEAIERRRMEEEREKEKRKQHYHNKVKAVRPSKSVRPVRIEKADPPITEVPKTWMGKFWKWMRP